MSHLPLLSRFAQALNPRAREGLSALLPDEIASAMGPPSGGQEGAAWEEALLAVLQKTADSTDEGDGLAPAEEGPNAGDSVGLVALSALLLSTATQPVQGAHFLYNLPLHLQAPVLHRLLTRSKLSCLRGLSDEEGAWVGWLRQQLTAEEHWGFQQAAAIMRRADQPRVMRQLLEGVSAIDRSSALVLQQHLYHFDDLLQLSDRDVQLVLASESTETLALALSGLSPAARKGFLAHISKRRRVLIAEEAERYAEATAEEIEQAQGAVLAVARLLYERRRITTYMGALSAEREGDRVDEPLPQEEERQGEAGGKTKRRGKKRSQTRTNPLKKLAAVAVCTALFAAVFLLIPNADDVGQENEGETQKKEVVGEAGASRVEVLLDALSAGGSEEGAGEHDRVQGAREAPQALVAVPGAEGIYAAGEFEVGEPFTEGAIDSTLRVLNLRVGRLQATVLEERFAVQTPLVTIRAPVGTVYSVRVVLDATTEVRVEKGRVEIEAIAGAGARMQLAAGEARTFTAGGNW